MPGICQLQVPGISYVVSLLSDHQRSYECEDGVELRKSGVDHGVGLNVVSLRDTYDTVSADLTLTDG